LTIPQNASIDYERKKLRIKLKIMIKSDIDLASLFVAAETYYS